MAIGIDGQVRLVRLQADNFLTNFHLHDEQTVNGLRKIAWASVFHFCLKRQDIYMYVYLCTYTVHVYAVVGKSFKK